MSAGDVFINVPFDQPYEPLYIALITALTAHGFRPRSVLEIPPSRSRLERLVDSIRACGASVHDLSRTSTSGADRVPRFNMPFELGLAVALGNAPPRAHEWFVLEEKTFRLQRSLSDLNGFDPLIHDGTAVGVLRSISNAFDARDRRVRLPQLLLTFNAVAAVAKTIKKEHSTLYSRRAFAELVATAQGVGSKRFAVAKARVERRRAQNTAL